jgi:hypothetical protein
VRTLLTTLSLLLQYSLIILMYVCEREREREREREGRREVRVGSMRGRGGGVASLSTLRVLPDHSISSSLLLPSLVLSDRRVYQPDIRARLGTTAHFCNVVVTRKPTTQLSLTLQGCLAHKRLQPH